MNPPGWTPFVVPAAHVTADGGISAAHPTGGYVGAYHGPSGLFAFNLTAPKKFECEMYDRRPGSVRWVYRLEPIPDTPWLRVVAVRRKYAGRARRR